MRGEGSECGSKAGNISMRKEQQNDTKGIRGWEDKKSNEKRNKKGMTKIKPMRRWEERIRWRNREIN